MGPTKEELINAMGELKYIRGVVDAGAKLDIGLYDMVQQSFAYVEHVLKMALNGEDADE